jgi:hypothetical protein
MFEQHNTVTRSFAFLKQIELHVCSLGNLLSWHDKINLFHRHVDIICAKFLKHVRQLCEFQMFGTYSISTVLVECYPKPAFPSRQLTKSVALKSLCPGCLANSSDLLFNIGPLTRTSRPVTIDSHWLRASSACGSWPSRFRFWEVPCYPWRNVHSSRSFSCCSITHAIVDFDTPVISASWRWLMSGGWFLIFFK